MKKKMMLNTITSLLLQATTVICGFILPRMILASYGSDVNGLVQSISQFLGIITFLELGVGQVIQSALYKPLARKDKESISKVVASGDKFFRRIAYVLVVYVILLVIGYPFIINQSFDWMYTGILIISISMSSFAQYFFGVVDRLLVNADQRGYVQYGTQILAILLNTIVGVILIKLGASIHIVKLASAIIFMLRPVVIRLYVRKNYDIDRKIQFVGEPIKQKWNGIAQHVSAFILTGTDNIVLTLFSTLENVSIYSVYYLIIYGIRQLFESSTNGLHSIVGDLWAKKELVKLNRIYGYIEIVLHFGTVFFYTCTVVLLFPFIRVYTNGVNDINYIQPMFGILLSLAYALQCIRTTYNMVILAGGHYKQTQISHIVAAGLNLGLSVVLVNWLGLVGIAIGTLIAMTYQTVWMAWYTSKNLIKWPFVNFIKLCVIDVITAGLIVLATSWISLTEVTYLAWFIMAVKVGIIAFVIVAIMALLFYKNRVLGIVRGLLNRRK